MVKPPAHLFLNSFRRGFLDAAAGRRPRRVSGGMGLLASRFVVTPAALRGYLLEEALAWLLRGSGYRLIADATEDPFELVVHAGALHVRGRGAMHQVDVLGELLFTPAFSLPVRLFLEAKFTTGRCGLQVVRNAHGVLFDVNENYTAGAGRPERRFRYNYALFSTGGFTPEAQRYAIAHQISLIDLSGAKYAWLRGPISAAAKALHVGAQQHGLERFPVAWLRSVLRGQLGTAEPQDALSELYATAEHMRFAADALPVLDILAGSLREYPTAQMLLGFPAAPFVLALSSRDVRRFAAYASENPTHDVRIRRVGSALASHWILSPADWPEAYELTFNLPEAVEEWIVENEARRTSRARQVKGQLLSNITIYSQVEGYERVYLLRYAPSQLREQ